MHTAYVIDGIIPQDKWFKLNFIIEEMIILTSQNTDRLDHGTLLLQRGFLVCCTRSYLFLNTYLKWMHIEIDSWNPYSNKLVCKMQGRELLSTMR